MKKDLGEFLREMETKCTFANCGSTEARYRICTVCFERLKNFPTLLRMVKAVVIGEQVGSIQAMQTVLEEK